MKIKNLKDSKWNRTCGEHTFAKDQVCEVPDELGIKMVELGYAVQVGGKKVDTAEKPVDGNPDLEGTTEKAEKDVASKEAGKKAKGKGKKGK